MPDDQQLALSDLHGETELAHALFRDGHCQEAVRKATERYINPVAELADLPDSEDRQGSALVNRAFSEDRPILAFNPRETLTERNEHSGYRFLAGGLVLALRNVMTHADSYALRETDALEWLAFISAMHRRLDGVQQVATQPASIESAEEQGTDQAATGS